MDFVDQIVIMALIFPRHALLLLAIIVTICCMLYFFKDNYMSITAVRLFHMNTLILLPHDNLLRLLYTVHE